MPHSQINDRKVNYKSKGVKAGHACNELRWYLGKGNQARHWRETSFNSQNGVDRCSFYLFIQQLWIIF